MTWASPWDALLRSRPIRLQTDDDPEAQGAKAGTKLASILAELAEVDSATTLSLCARTELDARQVWGLLKNPRKAGQVRFEAGRWSLNRDWNGRDIERAARLLRDAGWTVRAP